MKLRTLPFLAMCILLSGCENPTDCRLVARAYEAQVLEQELAEDLPEHEQNIVDAVRIQGLNADGIEYARAYRLCMKEYQ